MPFLNKIANSKPGKFLTAALSFGVSTIPLTYEMLNPPAIYAQATPEDLAFQTFDEIMNLDDNSAILIQRESRIKQSAKVKVFALADSIGDNNGYAINKETKKALAYLMDPRGAFGKIADKYPGNNNGIISQGELEALRKTKNYPGLLQVIEMWNLFGKPTLSSIN